MSLLMMMADSAIPDINNDIRQCCELFYHKFMPEYDTQQAVKRFESIIESNKKSTGAMFYEFAHNMAAKAKY